MNTANDPVYVKKRKQVVAQVSLSLFLGAMLVMSGLLIFSIDSPNSLGFMRKRDFRNSRSGGGGEKGFFEAAAPGVGKTLPKQEAVAPPPPGGPGAKNAAAGDAAVAAFKWREIGSWRGTWGLNSTRGFGGALGSLRRHQSGSAAGAGLLMLALMLLLLSAATSILRHAAAERMRILQIFGLSNRLRVDPYDRYAAEAYGGPRAIRALAPYGRFGPDPFQVVDPYGPSLEDELHEEELEEEQEGEESEEEETDDDCDPR